MGVRVAAAVAAVTTVAVAVVAAAATMQAAISMAAVAVAAVHHMLSPKPLTLETAKELQQPATVKSRFHGDKIAMTYFADVNLEKEFWITPAYSRAKDRVIIAGATVNSKPVLGYWHYPAGGQPFATIAGGLWSSAVNATVSTVL
jgi:hypothetical protein